MAFVLMPKRTKRMYEDMFQNLQKVAEMPIKPSALSCDFEAAVIQTVQKLFPSTKIQLCRFHFYQSVKRRLVREFTKTFYEKKELKEVWNIIKGCSYFGWTQYPDMLQILEEHLRSRNMFFNNQIEERKYSEFLDYIFTYYLTFDHSFGLMNQDHYTALLNGDPDATNNTSESINKSLKSYASTGKKNIHTVFRSIYNYKMDHNQRMDSGERYAKRRPEELILKYENIKNTLNQFDNLPTALKPISLLSTLQYLGEL